MARGAISATLLVDEKIVMADGAIAELVIWRLPKATRERPHGLKYRLYFGRGGRCIVRYDNETGKGDHRHAGDKEEPYRFVSVERLRNDFESDIRRHQKDHEKED